MFGMGGMIWQGKTWVLKVKSLPVPLCLPQTPVAHLHLFHELKTLPLLVSTGNENIICGLLVCSLQCNNCISSRLKCLSRMQMFECFLSLTWLSLLYLLGYPKLEWHAFAVLTLCVFEPEFSHSRTISRSHEVRNIQIAYYS